MLVPPDQHPAPLGSFKLRGLLSMLAAGPWHRCRFGRRVAMKRSSPRRGSRYPKRPWKHGYRKLPPGILARVSSFAANDVRVGCTRKISRQALESGIYAHIGLGWDSERPKFDEAVIPSPDNGHSSNINVNGREIVRKDLPKTSKTFDAYVPNWGDWSNGGHTISWDRDVYPREWEPSRELAIKVELIGEEVVTQIFVFKFTVDEVLDRSGQGFGKQLLATVNLLQENVGASNVYPSNATVADYLGSIFVNWELLPPGERDNNIARILSGIRGNESRVRQNLIERYDSLAKLRPVHFIQGTDGFRNYFGAQFAPDLVVFENIEYGNAIYVLFEDWESLSKKSRTELLTLHPDRIVRIPHTSQWKPRLSQVVRSELRKRRPAA
jgi:hypothetical protein